MAKVSLIFLFLMAMISCEKKEIIPPATPSQYLIWGFSIDGFPITESALETLVRETKIQPQIVQFYLQWQKEPSLSLLSSLQAIASQNSSPCITWEPMLMIDNSEKTIAFDQILNGDFDEYLNFIANEIKQFQKPVIVRFAQEMNLQRYHWGTTLEQFGPESPAIYVKLFRYVVEFFRKEGANNVLWAFCPNSESVPNEFWNTAKNFYPGDDYVDLLGMDGYNWAITFEIAKNRDLNWTKPWMSFEEIFKNLYVELRKMAPSKPIFVFETASVNRKELKKTTWLKEAINTAKKWGLKGILWFQAKKEEDWRLQQDGDFSYLRDVMDAMHGNG